MMQDLFPDDIWAAKLPPHLWIKTYMLGVVNPGETEPLFDKIAWFALKVVGVSTSASACEHSWSIEAWIHSTRRNRLGQSLVEKLVRGHMNITLADALTMGDNTLPWDIELTIDEPEA